MPSFAVLIDTSPQCASTSCGSRTSCPLSLARSHFAPLVPLVLFVPFLVVELAALALALAALERTVEVGQATVAANIPDHPKLPSRPLFLLVLVPVRMGKHSSDAPSSHNYSIASTLQQVLALVPMQTVDTAAGGECKQVAWAVEVLAVV